MNGKVTMLLPNQPIIREDELLVIRDSIDLAKENARIFRQQEEALRSRKFATTDGALYWHYQDAIARTVITAEIWETKALQAEKLYAEREQAA